MFRGILFVSKYTIAFMLLVMMAGCGKSATPSGSSPASQAARGKTEKFAVSFSAERLASEPETGSGARASAASDRANSDEPSTLNSQPSTSSGRIVGVVKWNGTPPTLERVMVPKDGHVCAEHGRHDRPSEVLIINPSNGGVKDSVVHLFGKFENADAAALAELKYPDTLNQRQCSYEPRVFVVPLGARLVMTSEDDVGHNVRMGGAADLNIAISKDVRTSRRFEQAGVVKLGCDIHPWMTGYIHVVKHPYYAVTDADGRFELSNVPPGTHEIRLWHEPWWRDDDKLGNPIAVTHSVTVRAGETTRVTFEFSEPALTQMAGGKSGKGTSKR